MKTTIFLIICLSVLLRMRNISDERCEIIKTQILYVITFFISCIFLDNVEKYCTAGQATDDNTTYAHCKPDT